MIVALLVTFAMIDGSCSNLADEYLDSIIGETLEREIKNMKLDPAPLPDFGIPFKQIGPIPVSGRVDYHNGIFNGLSRIRRFRQCDGPSININEVKMECAMNFFGMNTVYDGKARVEQFPPIPFQVTAYINETIVRSAIAGQPASLKGQLKALEIEKFGDINVRLSNLGPFQYIYNVVEEEFRERVREEIISIIISQFPVAFKKAITQARLPGLGKRR